jgi:thiol-disulfide isomerase/thioredoxin
VIGVLERVGGVLLAPRRLLASLSDPGTGRRDGALLLLAFVLAVGLPALADAVADWWALGGLGGALGLLTGLLPLLPWVIATTVIEWTLGDARAHRAALCLVPLLVIAALAHLLAALGVRLPGPDYLPAVLGGMASLALAWAVRRSIAPVGAAARDLSAETGASVPADMSIETASHVPKDMPHRPAAIAGARPVGLVVAALVLCSAGLDVARVVRTWSTLAPVAAGSVIPEFELPLLDGGSLRAADLRGRPSLLIFWTTWCGVCLGELPMYRALAEQHPELQVLGVNADREGDVPALVAAYRDAHALRFPIALDDGRLARALRVRMFPHLVLVDGAGQVRAVFQGRAFARSIESALAGL